MLRRAMREREPAPKDEYRRRESLHQERAANSRRFEERISRARLGVALTAALVAWLAFGAAVLSPWWLAAPALAFATLVGVHGRARARRPQAARRAALYRRGRALLAGQAAGGGRTGGRLRGPPHPSAHGL